MAEIRVSITCAMLRTMGAMMAPVVEAAPSLGVWKWEFTPQKPAEDE